MITNTGKTVITNYFGQQTPLIGGALAIGVGSAVESATDAGLGFEVQRIPVTVTAADLANSRVVFKGVLAAPAVGTVYELGLYHQNYSDQGQNINLTPATGTWTNGSVVGGNSRISSSSVQVNAAASATTLATLSGSNYGLSQFSSGDSIIAAFTADANTAAMTVVIGNDASNYMTWTFTPQAGYNTVRLDYSAGVTTGNPNMGSATYIGVGAQATAAGATALYADGVRFEKTVTNDELVARVVLATPTALDQSVPTEIEYSLEITV